MTINNRRTNNKKISKNFKDYIVPIVIVFIISIFVLNLMFGSDETTNTQTDLKSSISITLSGSNNESYLIKTNGEKTKITGNTQFSEGEKIQIANGIINMKLPENKGSFSLNRLGELKYNENGGYSLFASDLWVNNNSNISIEMKYGIVNASSGSVFSISQNDISSSVYLMTGDIEVKTTAGSAVTLQKGEKISIMRNQANDKDFNIGTEKAQIDEYYIKNDEWFALNNGSNYLIPVSLDGTNSGSINSGSLSDSVIGENNLNTTTYITFNNLRDEGQVDSSVLNIEGKILMDSVFKIDLNGVEAVLDFNNKTFSIKNFKFSNKINDLVYRVYSESGNIIYKGVLTVYYSGGSNSNLLGTNTENTSGNAKVQNYSIEKSPLYKIISPKQNPFTTSTKLVRIEGTVPYGTVEKILINGFRLQKFPAYGSYWSYFANTEFGNLKDGLNIYNIQYFGKGDSLLYENAFSIIKKDPEILNIKTEPVVTDLETTTSNGIIPEIIVGEEIKKDDIITE